MAGDAGAGGWPLAPGTGELIVPVTRSTADERYDGAGNKQWKPRYTKLEVAPYGEYGLTGSLTLVGEFAWTSDETDFFGTKFRERGLTRVKAGGRLAIGTWKDIQFSLQPLATIHMARDGNDPAATGNGDLDLEMALVVAQGDKLLVSMRFRCRNLATAIATANDPTSCARILPWD